MDDYLDESSYIEGNINQLAMCHADTDCKLESSMLQICKNKCDQEVGLDEDCEINGCSESDNDSSVSFYFDKKDIHKCYGNSKEECNSLPGCEYSDTTEICSSKCYNLSQDECTTNEQCYLTSYGSCSERQCDEDQESSFPTDVTNAVSNLNLRTHYCTKKCSGGENPGNECHSFDLNKCRRENKCSVLDKFVVPKCVPNNVN